MLNQSPPLTRDLTMLAFTVTVCMLTLGGMIAYDHFHPQS